MYKEKPKGDSEKDVKVGKDGETPLIARDREAGEASGRGTKR